jgi:signal transduction histidine kinase/ligand-binding sensor domain-containing protein
MMGFVMTRVAGAPGWAVKKWDLEDGLSSLAITGLAQTEDGFIWIATRAMLTRFDGNHFVDFASSEFLPSPVRGFRALLHDRSGGVWLMADPHALVRLGAGQAQTFTLPVAGPPFAMAEDAAGAIWITYASGTVCRLANGQIEILDAATGLPGGTGGVALVRDGAGTLWFAKNGALGVWRDGRFLTLQRIGPGPMQLAAAREGGVWICSGSELFRHDHRTFASHGRLGAEREGTSPTTMLEDDEGAVWIGTALSGLFRYRDGAFEEIAVSDRGISALLQDREGNLWVGTNGGGLERVQRRVFELEGVAQGLPPEMVQSLSEDIRGTLWAAGRNGALLRRTVSGWETVPIDSAFVGGITCVTADPRGGLWLGTRRRTLLHLDDKHRQSWGAAAGLTVQVVHALHVARNGDLWIGGEQPHALQRLRDGQLDSLAVPPNFRQPRVIAEDESGSVWVRGDRTLWRVSGSRVSDETSRLRGLDKAARSFATTPDGALWIGYGGGGLVRLKDDDFGLVGNRQGLLDERVSQLLADGLGWFWIGSDRGIFKVAQSELEGVLAGGSSRVHSTYYARNVGLPSQPALYGFHPTATRTRDGRLWMPLRTGLAVISPQHLPRDATAPAVRMMQVAVDGQVHAAYLAPWAGAGVDLRTGSHRLKLAPDHRRLEFTFTAPTFRSPENVQFRYRLDGQDDDWVVAGNKRTASYARLPAGEYRFRVSASNADGVWNETGASVAFAVAPFVWQTWWFRGGALGLFTLGVVALVRYASHRRLRAKLKALEQQVALDRERTRIARDIHDDLGGSLTQIALLSDRALAEHSGLNGATEHVAGISARVREGIRSLDEIVWAINPSNDTLEHLLDYIGQHAVDFLRVAGIRCQVDLPVTVPAHVVPADARHSLFLAVKESLNNIVRHAAATEVVLRGMIGPDAIELTLRDNGRGFAGPPADAYANGLRNLGQRMSEVGGAYEVTSAPGEGTTVRLTLGLAGENRQNERSVAPPTRSGLR